MFCPLGVLLCVAMHKSKDKLKVQVEPFFILLLSCDLCL